MDLFKNVKKERQQCFEDSHKFGDPEILVGKREKKSLYLNTYLYCCLETLVLSLHQGPTMFLNYNFNPYRLQIIYYLSHLVYLA